MAEVGRLGIPPTGPHQLQALALRCPTYAGLADLVFLVHVLSVPEDDLEEN